MSTKSINEMHPGETSVISGLQESDLTNKLLEMGFLPGTAVRMNFLAPLGDPICVSISGYDISLRIEEAAMVHVL